MTQPVGTDTIERIDGVVGHDQEAYPGLESIERKGSRIRAYADRETSLVTLFDSAVSQAPDREAFVYPERDRRTTYVELDDSVSRIATGLAEAGLEKGDVVSLLLSNRPAFIETWLACARLGAVCGPINTRVSGRELGYLLEDSGPSCLITEPAFLDILASAEYDPERLFVAGGPADRGRPFSALRDARHAPPAVDHTEDDPVAVFYTSGTTGRPKGCLVENFHLTNAAVNYVTSFGTDHGLRALTTVPLFHVAGLVANVLHALVLAGTTVVLDEFTPDRFLGALAAEDVEYSLSVPTNYTLAMERGDPSTYDLESWEIAAYGGAPMPSETVSKLREAFPGLDLCDAYGTTETVGGLVTLCPDRYTDDHAGTIGIPTPPVQLTVVDEDGVRLGPGAIGQLLIKGPIVVDRYLDRPDATAESFADGWYHTGDLAEIDDDGFVSLKGRTRDKLVRGGENVYALDIEEVLTVHDGVLEASVTGIPDEVLGERVLAAVVPTPGYQLTEDEIVAHCEERLADYKVPEVVRILSDLPKNPGGKVLKRELLPEPLQYGIAADDS